MRIVVLVTLLLASGSFPVLAALPDDAALGKTVNLAVKGGAVSDVLSTLQEQTGVHMRAAPEIADQKVTIFVNQEALRDVLQGISTLLKCEWTSRVSEGRTTYELRRDEGILLDLEQRWQNARSKAWQVAVDEIKLKERFGLMTDAQREAYRRSLFADMARHAIKDGLEQLDALNEVSREPLTGIVASLLVSSPKALKALQDGMSVCYDIKSPDQEWKLRDTLMRRIIALKLRADNQGSPIEDIELVQMNVCMAPLESSRAVHIETTASITYRNKEGKNFSGRLGGTLAFVPIADFFELPQDYLPSSGEALQREVVLEPNDLSNTSLVRTDSQSVTYSLINRSDVLEALHKKYGLQVISDHYSHWYQWSLPRKGTIANVLSAFNAGMDLPNSPTYKAVCGADDRYLYMRCVDTHYADAAEVPDRFLRVWQESYAKNGHLELDELGQIAQLSREQIGMLKRNSRQLGLGDNLPTGEALRLYGMLGPQQKERARTKGLNVSEMTALQRQVLLRLISNDARIAGIHNGEGLGVDSLQLSREQESMKLFVRTYHYKQYQYQSNGSSTEPVSIKATSLDEALKKIREMYPQANPEDIKMADVTSYYLSVQSKTEAGPIKELTFPLM